MLHIRMLCNRQAVAQWRHILNIGYRWGGGGTGGRRHASDALTSIYINGIHCIESWVASWAGLTGYGE